MGKITDAFIKQFHETEGQVLKPFKAIKQKYDTAMTNWQNSPRYKKAQENFRTGKGRL